MKGARRIPPGSRSEPRPSHEAVSPHELDSQHELELSAVIDARPLGLFQVRVTLLCMLALVLDAFDSTSIGFVAPRLSELWHLAPGALGPVFAWGFVGQLIGAVTAGPIAER